MNDNQHLKYSAVLSVFAFLLLVLSVFIANSGPYPASQEIFEVIGNVEIYSAAIANAAPVLRTVLFVDALFSLAYTGAICFALLAFANRNLPFAWFAGMGIITVMLLDYAENFTMIQSMDILATGGALSLDHIISQVSISSLKWHVAAAALFSVSFVLPSRGLIEKLLVWGTRLGLAFAVPLFVTNAFSLREEGGILILSSMAGGFVLLALVTWNRSRIV